MSYAMKYHHSGLPQSMSNVDQNCVIDPNADQYRSILLHTFERYFGSMPGF